MIHLKRKVHWFVLLCTALLSGVLSAQTVREEAVLLDTLLKARHAAGLTQADVAERMGTLPPAVARLERSLATGKHSPSIATVRKYVKACGKKLVLQVA